MSVTNRKMFKRDARDKVRQMGGIMASSEPLIQEVARFNPGGSVRKPSMLELMFQPPVTLTTVPGIKGTQSRGGPPYATAVDPQRTFMGVKLPDFIKTDSDIKNTMPNYNILQGFGGPNLNLLPLAAEEGEDFVTSFSKVDPESDTIEGKAKKGLINFGNYVQNNPAEAAGILGLSIVPGGLLYKGMKYTPKMFGALSRILFGSGTRAAGTASVLGGTAYVNQDSINEFLKEGGLGKLYTGTIEQAKNLPENIAKGKKALDESLGIKGPDAKRPQYPEQLGDNLAPSSEVAQATTKDGPQYPEQLGDNLALDQKALDPNRRAKPESYPETGTLGVTADQGAYAKDKKSTEDFRNGNKSLNEIKNDVQNTVKNGVGVGGSMKQLVDEFTGSVEKFKGMDRGLAIAKIGFAMAAGESPNAITNIAKALSDGADMFIKDQAERDAWNRQVNLAAVQYGATELSKRRAEGRAIARERLKSKTMTFGPKGGEYRGKKYGAYEDVEVLNADIQDNNVPTGIVSTSTIKALGTKGKGFDALTRKLIEDKILSEEGGRKDQKAYADFVDTAITAERGQVLVNKVLLNINDPDGGITGITPAMKKIQRKILDTVGQRTEIDSITEAQTYMRQLLQDVVPVTIGGYQGANSISNRDIDLLITAFFGDNALEEGNFQFVTQNTGEISKRLQGVAARMKQSQSSAFAGMKSLEQRLSTQFQRGSVNLTSTGEITGISALNLLAEDRKRLEDKGLSFEGSPTGSSVGYYRDDQGIIQFKS
jgi:hypothetical protein